MVTPSDHADEIRCSMCGKPNPPDAEICQHCGSRLKPVSSLDDLLGSSLSGSPTEADRSDPDDLFDAMRAQFDDDGSSAPAEPAHTSLPEPEPDFSFGSSSSSNEDALPSFLSNLRPEDPSEDADETPDWLSELERPAEDAVADTGGAPGQLSSAGDRAQEPMTLPATGGDTPDWLTEFDSLSQPASPPEPTAGFADLPDWLSDLAGFAPDQPSAGVSEPETGDLDWLSDYAADDEPDTLVVDTGKAEEESSTTASMDSFLIEERLGEGPDKEPRLSAADDAVPDWLSDLTGEEAPEEEPEAQPLDASTPPPLPGGALPSPLVETVTPAWLIQQRADEAAEEAAAEAAATPPTEAAEPVVQPVRAEETPEPALAEEPIPGWLADLEDAEEEPIPGWMTELAGDSEPEFTAEPTAQQPVGEAEELSVWMEELSAESEPQPEAESESEPVPDIEIEEEISLDWIDQLEPEAADDEWMAALDFSSEPVAPVGDDLLGLSSDFSPISEKPAKETAFDEDQEVAKAVDFGDLPEWLQGIGEMAGSAIPDSERPLAPSADVSAEELAEIQNLRYEALTGQERGQHEEQTESVGALKDVRGVIQPELIFEGSTLTVTEPVQQVIITQTQAHKVELVQRLLQRESDPFTTAEVGFQLPIVRWLVALLMILAVAGPLLTGTFILPAPEPASNVVSAYQAIDGMTAIDAVVLIAIEYEPDSAGEMDPLAEALLWHLAQKSNITVYTLSTRPTGPAMADAILARGGISPRLAANGGTWQNLGYVSGQANGVSSLASGSATDVSSPFSFDSSGQPTGLAATSLSAASVDQLIVLAARPDDARMWIEQASQPTGIPLIAAVGASAAPLLRPYVANGQIAGLVVGLNDAVAYWRLGGHQVGRALLSRYNAQAVGSLVAAALILCGGIVYGILSLRNRKESLS